MTIFCQTCTTTEAVFDWMAGAPSAAPTFDNTEIEDVNDAYDDYSDTEIFYYLA